VPAWQARFSLFDEMVGHFRRYDPEHLQERLDTAGFVDIHVEPYGFPAGHVLEACRNFAAIRMAKHDAGKADYAGRTAASGRVMQPGRGMMGDLVQMAARPMVWTQRLFPGRGVGLVARACKTL